MMNPNRLASITFCLAVTAASGLSADEAGVVKPDAPAAATVDQKALAEQVAAPLIDAIKSLDTDGTGEVKLLDVVKRLRPYGYGVVSEAAASAPGRGRRAGRESGSRGGGSRGGNRGAPSDEAQLRARYDSFDRNRDGVWKGDEINTYMSSHPASNDGEVTFEEFQKAWAEIRSGQGHGGQGHGGQGRGRQGHGGGGHGGRGSHGGGGNHGGGGHTHGGTPISAAARSSGDALFVTSLDVDRNRLITVEEVRRAVAKEIAKQLAPKPEADEAAGERIEATATPEPTDSRRSRFVARRLVTRSHAIRAVLLLSDAKRPGDTVNAGLLDGHVDAPETRDQIWGLLAGEASTIETKSVYPGLVRVSDAMLEKIQP